jgi:hypothetical protein
MKCFHVRVDASLGNAAFGRQFEVNGPLHAQYTESFGETAYP